MQLIIWKIRITRTPFHLFGCQASLVVLFVIACLFAFLETVTEKGTPPRLYVPLFLVVCWIKNRSPQTTKLIFRMFALFR